VGGANKHLWYSEGNLLITKSITMALINVSVCLSDIPEWARKKSENGKWYCSLTVADRKEKDKYENTHTVYVNKTKEQREANPEKHYVGNGKAVSFDQPKAAEPETDLPF
jgi:hypothetical protein